MRGGLWSYSSVFCQTLSLGTWKSRTDRHVESFWSTIRLLSPFFIFLWKFKQYDPAALNLSNFCWLHLWLDQKRFLWISIQQFQWSEAQSILMKFPTYGLLVQNYQSLNTSMIFYYKSERHLLWKSMAPAAEVETITLSQTQLWTVMCHKDPCCRNGLCWYHYSEDFFSSVFEEHLWLNPTTISISWFFFFFKFALIPFEKQMYLCQAWLHPIPWTVIRRIL